jgi:hypothetical protein
MADQTTIITGSVPGSLKSAFDGMPPWATNAVLEEIKGILNDQLKNSINSVQGALSAKDAKEINKQLELFEENLIAANKQMKEDEEAEKKRNKEILEEAAKRKERSKAFVASLLSMADTAKIVVTTMLANVKTYDQLIASGVNVLSVTDGMTDGFEAVRNIAVITGVRFTELAATMQKYSVAINSYGTGKFVKTVAIASKSLQAFGYSSKETAELTGQYLEIQRGFSNTYNRSLKDTGMNVKQFGQSITEVSMATGMSRDVILNNIDAISKSSAANSLVAQSGEKASQSLMTFLGGLKDQNFAKELLAMMTDPIKAVNATFSAFQHVGQGQLGQEMMNFANNLKNSNLTAEQQTQMLGQYYKSNAARIQADRAQIQQFDYAGSPVQAQAQAAEQFIDQMKAASNGITQMNAKDMAQMEKTNAASKAFATQLEKLKATLQSVFAPTAVQIQWLGDKLKQLNDGITWMTAKIGPNGMKIAGTVLAIVAFGGVIAKVTMGFLKMARSMSFLGLFGGKKGGSAIGGAVGKAGGGIGAAEEGILSGLGKGLAGLGKGLAGLGGGIGKGIGGVLTGIADGIASFGRMSVLFGAGVMLLVAADIWVLGKALQTFATVSIKDVGVMVAALAGIGGAAAAMGAFWPLLAAGALVMAGVGAGMQVFGEGVQSIGLGLQTMNNGLKNFDVNALKNIVSTINSLSLTHAAAIGALGVIKGVAGIFTTPSNSTIASPSKVSADAQANKASKEAATASSGTASGSTATKTDPVSSAIQEQTMVLSKVLETMNSTLSINKDILRYTKNR